MAVFTALAADPANNSGRAPSTVPDVSDEQPQTIEVGRVVRTAQRTNATRSKKPLSVDLIKRGSSSKKVRMTAVQSLPLDELTTENRKRADALIHSDSLFRQLPTVRFHADPKMYWFFATHPDVVIGIWQVMKISQFQMRQTGPNIHVVDAGDGSVGTLEILHRGPGQILVLCEGVYKSPFLIKTIEATALMHLQTQFERANDGRTIATHHCNLFVSFPSHTVETAAKLISPLSNLIADRNFQEISIFLQMMSLAMAHQPGWVEQIVSRLDGIPEVHKSQLLKLAARVYVVAQNRKLSKWLGLRQCSLDEVMAPLRAAAQSSSRGYNGFSKPSSRKADAPASHLGNFGQKAAARVVSKASSMPGG